MKLSVCRRNLLRSSALAALLIAGVASNANAADPTYQFNIPAESLSQALTDFSQASSQQIIYTEDLVRGRKSTGLHGTYTAEQALDALLAGTDLKIQVNAAGVMMVRSKNVQAASNEAASAGSGPVETVVVTGTNIRGLTSTSSPVYQIDRQQIEGSGYTTAEQLLHSVPQNFGGGASTSNGAGIGNGGGEGAGNNFALGASINLRGIGTEATLVMLNGHRLPASGVGDFVDISLLPLNAIDRVDVLADGASAIYGSDAVAGVVNFITRSDFNGAESRVRFGGATDGGYDTFQGSQLVGRTWSNGSALLSYNFQQNSVLRAPDLSCCNTLPAPNDVILPSTQHSILGSVSQQLSSGVMVFADATYAHRISNGADNFGAVEFLRSSVDQYTADAGATFDIGGDWQATGSFTFDHNMTHLTNNFPSFSFTSIFNGLSNAEIGDVKLDGSIFELPGGAARLAVGAQYRHETYGATGNSAPTASTLSRNVSAGFGELFLPFVESANARPGIQRLDVTVAGRYESYSDFGSTFNPKIGIMWSPVDDINLRGTYGTSFRAPLLSQLNTSGNAVAARTISDPSAAGGTSPVIFLFGNNASLKPETSSNWNIGADLHPSEMPGLTVSATYFSVNFSNKIENCVPTAARNSALTSGDLYASCINSSPDLTTVQQYFATPGFSNTTGATPAQIKDIINIRLVNGARRNVDGLDLLLTDAIPIESSVLTVGVNSTILFNYNDQYTANAPIAHNLDTVYFPVAFRLRGTASWVNGPLSVNTALNYTGSYSDTRTAAPIGGPSPRKNVDAYTTVDLNVDYQLPLTGVLGGTHISLSATNLFDAAPPFVAGPFGLNYDSTNASPIGRVVSLELVKEW